MSPARSTARLGMKRKTGLAASGSYDLPCTTFAATVPPETFAWYHRMVALLVVAPPQFAGVNSPRFTVCETHSDSAPPMFEYWFSAIARIASASAALAGVDAL